MPGGADDAPEDTVLSVEDMLLVEFDCWREVGSGGLFFQSWVFSSSHSFFFGAKMDTFAGQKNRVNGLFPSVFFFGVCFFYCLDRA